MSISILDTPLGMIGSFRSIAEAPGLVAGPPQEADRTGIGRLIDELRADRNIRLEAYRRYRHRLSISGKPLHYVAMVARKVRELDDEWTSL